MLFPGLGKEPPATPARTLATRSLIAELTEPPVTAGPRARAAEAPEPEPEDVLGNVGALIAAGAF